MAYLIKFGNAFDQEGLSMMTRVESRRRKIPINTSLSYSSSERLSPVAVSVPERKSKQLLRIEYEESVTENIRNQKRLWTSTGYVAAQGTALLVGCKVRVFMRHSGDLSYGECQQGRKRHRHRHRHRQRQRSGKEDEDEDGDDQREDGSDLEGEGDVEGDQHHQSDCPHCICGTVTCMLPCAFDFEALWGVVYDPSSLMRHYDRMAVLDRDAYSYSAPHVAVGGKEMHSSKGDSWQDTEDERKTNVLRGYETLSYADLQPILSNAFLNVNCSTVPSHQYIALDAAKAGKKFDNKNSKIATKLSNKDKILKDKIEKEKSEALLREKEKENQNVTTAVKRSEEEVEGEVARRVALEVDLARKRMEKTHVIELKKSADEIRMLKLTTAQHEKTYNEREKSMEVSERIVQSLKKEKEVWMEKRGREAKLSSEVTSLRKTQQDMKRDFSTKLAHTEMQLSAAVKSIAEEKDSLRLELGAGRKRETAKLTSQIKDLERALAAGTVAQEQTKSRKRARESATDGTSGGMGGSGSMSLSEGVSPKRNRTHSISMSVSVSSPDTHTSVPSPTRIENQLVERETATGGS